MVLPIGLGASAAAGAGNPSPPPNDGKQTNPQNTGQWRRGVELPSVPVVKYVRANKYPTYSVRSANGVCDIPSSAIDVCGNAIAIQGSNITTFYDNDIGTLGNVPEPCVPLFITLANACESEKGEAAPVATSCGADCVEYKPVSNGLWTWFTDILARTVALPASN